MVLPHDPGYRHHAAEGRGGAGEAREVPASSGVGRVSTSRAVGLGGSVGAGALQRDVVLILWIKNLTLQC